MNKLQMMTILRQHILANRYRPLQILAQRWPQNVTGRDITDPAKSHPVGSRTHNLLEKCSDNHSDDPSIIECAWIGSCMAGNFFNCRARWRIEPHLSDAIRYWL